MLIDRACYERGCACFDSRIDKDPVLVPNAEWQGLTDEEREATIDAVPAANLGGEYYGEELTALAVAIEAKLKEKNTWLKG